jgi:hypothetical protein
MVCLRLLLAKSSNPEERLIFIASVWSLKRRLPSVGEFTIIDRYDCPVP